MWGHNLPPLVDIGLTDLPKPPISYIPQLPLVLFFQNFKVPIGNLPPPNIEPNTKLPTIDDDLDDTDDFDFDLDEPSEPSESDDDNLSQDQLNKDMQTYIHERMLKVRSEASGKVPPTEISISQSSTKTQTSTSIKVSHIQKSGQN